MKKYASFPQVPREQLAFIMAGKKYLLARFALQLIVAVAFVVAVARGRPMVQPFALAGAVLVLAGLAIRRWSMAVMGIRFRGYAVRREEKGLETRGPYRVLRHPGYLGLALMDIGLPLALGVLWALPLAIIPLALIVRRIRLEEALLASAYAEYASFAAARRRLVPGVW